MVECLLTTCNEIAKRKLRVASKPVVMCTYKAEAEYVTRKLRRRGYELQAVTHTTYLGVDFGCARRHARATRVKRDTKHLNMSKKIRRFTSASRQYAVMT